MNNREDKHNDHNYKLNSDEVKEKSVLIDNRMNKL